MLAMYKFIYNLLWRIDGFEDAEHWGYKLENWAADAFHPTFRPEIRTNGPININNLFYKVEFFKLGEPHYSVNGPVRPEWENQCEIAPAE